MSAPLYLTLARALRSDIAKGRYAIGALLPTEHELCAQHEVSRHTAREALRLLQEEGLITRRRGIGTVVAATGLGRLTQNMGAITDLLQYARDARLDIESFAAKAKEGGLAKALDLTSPQGWAQLDGVRRIAQQPIALTTILVRADLCPPLERLKKHADAINTLLAELHGVTAASVRQEISAVALTAAQARKLKARPGDPALKTVRRYLDERGAPFQASVSIHPGDRFTYAMTLERK